MMIGHLRIAALCSFTEDFSCDLRRVGAQYVFPQVQDSSTVALGRADDPDGQRSRPKCN